MGANTWLQIDDALIASIGDATVISANERLRRALIDAFATARREPPQIFAIDEYLRTRFDDLRSRGEPRTLLSPLAQRLVWLECAPPLDGIDPEEIYPDVADAWRTMHAWCLADRLTEFEDNENHRLFRDWALRYNGVAKARRWITEPELALVIADAIRQGSISAEPLLLVGFDVMSSSVERLTAVTRSASKRVEGHEARDAGTTNVVYWEFDDPAEELNAAIRWVAERVERPGTTGAVVVPDAVANHDAIVGRLDALLNPSEAFATPTTSRFNISGGVALAGVPVVADAIRLLEWLTTPTPFEEVERLLRSPFFRFGVDPAQARAVTLPESYTAAELLRGQSASPLFEVVGTWRRVGLLRLDEAVRRLRVSLMRLGWPCADRLWPEAREATSAFETLLDELGECSQFVEPSDLSAMVRLIRRAATRRMFAPARPDSPLQVLGSLETVGLRFTHLWVTWLDDLSWPAVPRPNPFIPLRLQRAAGVPRCDASAEASFARRMTEHWSRSAETVVFSRARTRNDEPVGASWIVRAIAGDSAPSPQVDRIPRGHPFLQRSAASFLVDRNEPPVGRIDAGRLRHRGSAILRDQSACPFRAFARYRLYVEPQRTPHSFPDAVQRGTAAHVAVRVLFECLGPEVDPARLDDIDRSAAPQHAVEAGLATLGHVPAAFRESERARLRRLLDEWVQVEAVRSPYRIAALERTTPLSLGELEFDLQIDRIDHEGGEVLVFDYKTGDIEANSVFGERPEEPQLPMYAIATPEATAIAFAELQIGGCRLVGSARQPRASGSIRLRAAAEADGDWQRMKDLWRGRLTHLTDEFVNGVADVQPRDAKACRECDLHALCRIREIDRIVAN